MLFAHNEIEMSCVLQAMDSWNHPNFSYPNRHLSELPCCALNGKYSALYIKGRREGEGGKEEEERRKGGRGRREYQVCVCVCVCEGAGVAPFQVIPRFYGDFSPQL